MNGSRHPDLLARAWRVRTAHFPDEITFAVPGMLRYDSAYHVNRRESFVAVSVTGRACALSCEHCRGQLLKGMPAAESPEELTRLATWLQHNGCTGILVTGGCDEQGRVPLARFLGAIGRIKDSGISVLVHSGLVSRAEAEGLKEAGVDQVLCDVVGDGETIRAVYHLNKDPEDYLESLVHLQQAGLSVAPHVVVGLHFGELRGEHRAVENIGRIGVDRIVLVALKPLPGTPMAGVTGVPAEEVAALAATARIQNPQTPISFGCAKPYGPTKRLLEKALVDAGVNALAFPEEDTVRYAADKGLRHSFVERCCSVA